VGNETDIVMYEGAAKEITEADFNAALKFGQECCVPLIAAQKELAAKAGKQKARNQAQRRPEEILQEAKALAGDRFVPALLQPGKLNREAGLQRHQGGSRRKAGREVWRGESHAFVINDAFYYIQKEAVRKLILEMANVWTDAILTPFDRLPAKWESSAGARFGAVRPRRNAGRFARHAGHGRRRAGI
jgi:polyribonucleotide nucleotidyltransferase